MKLEVEQIDMEREEEVIVRCHDVGADWVGNVNDAAHLRRRCRSSLWAARAWQALKAGRRRACVGMQSGIGKAQNRDGGI